MKFINMEKILKMEKMFLVFSIKLLVKLWIVKIVIKYR